MAGFFSALSLFITISSKYLESATCQELFWVLGTQQRARQSPAAALREFKKNNKKKYLVVERYHAETSKEGDKRVAD